MKTILVKFQKSEIVDKIQQGNIWLTELEYYRRLERESNDEDIGDERENMIESNSYETPYGKNVRLLLKPSEDTTLNYAFCLFKPVFTNGMYSFSEKQKKKFAEWGDAALLIYDWDEVYCRIQNAITKLKLDTLHDMGLFQQEVSYYDENVPISHDTGDILSHGLYNFAFQKRKKYAYQNEYRLLLQMQVAENGFQKQEHVEIQIDSIESISKKVSTEEILTCGLYNGCVQRIC